MYIVGDAVFHIIILLSYVWFGVYEFSYFFVVCALIASSYSIGKIVLGIKLLVDIKEGPYESETYFMGIAETEELDCFSKTCVSHIFFDDDTLQRDYLLFDDIRTEAVYPGDKIIIRYYKRSRIITMLHKKNEDS